jgi:hypothetical protein
MICYFSMLSVLRLYSDDRMSNDCGVVREIKIGRVNGSTQRKTCPSATLSTINLT